jgi:hypothetical protein
MKRKKFKRELLSGHRDHAVEVPLDPPREWNIQPQPLWRGRRGYEVMTRANGVSFERAVVPKQKKFYLLIDAEIMRAANLAESDVVNVELRPSQ